MNIYGNYNLDILVTLDDKFFLYTLYIYVRIRYSCIDT